MKKTTKTVLRIAVKYAAKSAKKAAVKMAADAVKESAGINTRRKPAQIAETVIMRDMRRGDRREVLEMMREFYSSEAVLSNGSDEIFNNDISECISDRPYAEGFVFEPEAPAVEAEEADTGQDAEKKLLGYAMIAHSFSTEYGRHCVWIEDIYIREEARGLGLASAFLDYIKNEYPDALHRLESEHENGHAMEIYRKNGFRELPYVEMVRDAD